MSSTRETGRVALVTGASRGIGLAVARTLGRDGCAVLMTDIDADALAESYTTLKDEGMSVDHIPVDLADSAAAGCLVPAVIERWGRIDVLVNNAAFHGKRQSVLVADPQDWQTIFAVNVFAAATLARAAATDMTRRREGAIVNIGSVQSALPVLSYAAYVTSKGAIEALSRALAAELGEFGITCNCVAPGVIGTEHYAENLVDLRFNGQAQTLASLLGRSGTPAEVAEAVAFLAGPRARFITGTTLRVDGGRAISRRSDPFQTDIVHPTPQGPPDG